MQILVVEVGDTEVKILVMGQKTSPVCIWYHLNGHSNGLRSVYRRLKAL
jgi:hypothetical protein